MTSIWDIRDNLDYDLPLQPGDPRIVPLNDARGNFSERRILRQLGVDDASGELRWIPDHQYILFGGHRGCGKSTELRRLAKDLADPKSFYVIFVDALKSLDVHNLRYSDILLAQAKALVDRLERDQVVVEQVFLSRLENWFRERVEKREQTRDMAAQIKAGARAKTGIPFLSSLFAELVNTVRLNSSYKEELRLIVRNTFAEFADGFNQLIQHAEEAIVARDLGRKILFVIDGTDRLTGEDSEYFFVRDIHQLRLVESNFIYCAPIDLLTEEGQLRQNFDEVFRLPMVKLAEKSGAPENPKARELLREFVHKRAAAELFKDPGVLDYLIDHSGGHPRDLLRLLNYAFLDLAGERFDQAAAESAVRKLATEYRRLLEPEDYRLLVEIDTGPGEYTPVSERSRDLLYKLTLLEYNSFWWHSHPVVRNLPGYVDALAKADGEK